jgi:hypothetical protein
MLKMFSYRHNWDFYLSELFKQYCDTFVVISNRDNIAVSFCYVLVFMCLEGGR